MNLLQYGRIKKNLKQSKATVVLKAKRKFTHDIKSQVYKVRRRGRVTRSAMSDLNQANAVATPTAHTFARHYAEPALLFVTSAQHSDVKNDANCPL